MTLKIDPKEYTSTRNDKLDGIYRGVVEDNWSDPEKMGRCRIRVFGIHTPNKIKNDYDGIPTDELPWAEPVMGLFEGSMSGFGSWTVPLQGSHVFLFFEGGNILKPKYFATVPGKPTDQKHGIEEGEGFSDPDGNYPVQSTEAPHKPNQLNESDFHRLARNEGTGETIVQSKTNNKDTGVNIAQGGTWSEPNPYYAAEYPHNKVFSTHSGITIEIDDTDGEERIHIYHPSNSYIEINSEGSIIIRNSKDKFEIVDNDKKQHIMSNLDRTVDGNRTSKVGNNQTEEIGNDKNIEVGNDTDHTSGNVHTVNAKTIHLNPW